MAPPLYDKGWVSSSKPHQGTQFGQEASLSRARQFSLTQYPIGRVIQEAQAKQKSLNMTQALRQKQDEDPSEFLERIYQAYRKLTDADLQAPENVQMVNTTCRLAFGKVPQISERNSRA